jgi:CubicO group peptidase (beta-lactamase class C family)
VVRRARYLKVVAPFRERMVYSNVGYSIAGEVIAAAGAAPFETLLRDLVIRPLGLGSTTWTYEQAAGLPNLASPHATIQGRQQPLPRERQRQSVAPAASVQSSMADLARWMRLHLNRGVLEGVRFVSDTALGELSRKQSVIPTTAAMRAARQVRDSASAGYGLGLQVMDYRGHPLVWHTGNGDGQVAYMVLLPADRLGIVVVVNTWSAPMIHLALVNRVMDYYLGFEARDWAGEALARIPRGVAAQDSAVRALMGGATQGAPPRPLEAYAGNYEESLFGPIVVRRDGPRLTLQMGEGRLADLVYHHGESFLVCWRDPFFREFYLTMADFAPEPGGPGFTVHMLLNRDHITAVRRP